MSYYSTVVHRQLVANAVRLSDSGMPTDRMSPALDDLSMRFALFVRNTHGYVLDIGCGDGIAAVAGLARGARIYAVDPDQAALHHLLARVPPAYAHRLRVRVGSLPTVSFECPRFSAIHAARVLHLLDPPALQQSLRKFFQWLQPDGKLFLSTLTPAGDYWAFAEGEIQRKKLAHDPWPGYVREMSHLRPYWDGASHHVHLLDEPILRRELEAAGFGIEHIDSYPLPWAADQRCCAVIAGPVRAI